MRGLARQIGRLSCLLALVTGCGHLVYADGPYHGRVLDAETKQPIEGAAVLAVWLKRSYGEGHPSITYYDAQETLTDQDGYFTIRGIVHMSLNLLARIDEPQFTIFKPRHEAYGNRRLSPPEPGGLRVVILRPISTREDRLKSLSRTSPYSVCLTEEEADRLKMPDLSPGTPDCIPRDKIPNLIRLKDTEHKQLGLGQR
jgi:hypothetical protein